MPRPMRRSRQQMTDAECITVLQRGTACVLALQGDEDYPYAVPVSFVYAPGQIIFHCALEGHKIDCLRANPKVSLCVVDKDDVVPEAFTTRYRSVVVFGTARILTEPGEWRAALEAMAERCAPGPGFAAMRQAEIDKNGARTCVVAVSVDHMTGKQSLALQGQPL